jgi:hypothetical protein
MAMYGMSETVKFRIVVHVDAEDEIDTGLTVKQWNALSNGERDQWRDDAWEALVQGDDGGCSVLTEGAKDL